jgi:predicted enzyme related to lactoylglutathione lyase
MSFSGWDEDIMTPLKGGGPTLIPMKFKTGGSSPISEDRPVKDLPVKLTFTVPDAKAMVGKIVGAGGKAVVDVPKGAKEGMLYAKDPDGYLLELLPGGSGIAFTGAGYGSSDPTKSASFFSKLAGTTSGPMAKAEGGWDTVVVPTKKKFEMTFVDFKDQRPTKKLPLKIVWSVPSIPGFKKTITENGGSLVEKGLGVLGAFVGLGYDSVDQIMIEINSGSG